MRFQPFRRAVHIGSRSRRAFATIALTALGAGVIPALSLAALAGSRAQDACESRFSPVFADLEDVTRQNTTAADPARADKVVSEAATLFRFHRREDALARLDAALELLGGTWGQPVEPDTRRRTTIDMKRLRTCLETHQPPAMATLTVRTFNVDPKGQRVPAGAGVFVLVEDRGVGRTGGDGTVTVPVPSGDLHITAQLPPSSAGEAFVAIAPGATSAVSIVLDSEKEIVEVTDLVFVELAGDTIPSATTSFTLKFIRDGVFLPVARIDAVDLLNRDGDIAQMLDKSFSVVGGTISAMDPVALHAMLAKYAGERVGFRVQAVDQNGATHANVVWLRMEPPKKHQLPSRSDLRDR